jgi:hypothetical protein
MDLSAYTGNHIEQSILGLPDDFVVLEPKEKEKARAVHDNNTFETDYPRNDSTWGVLLRIDRSNALEYMEASEYFKSAKKINDEWVAVLFNDRLTTHVLNANSHEQWAEDLLREWSYQSPLLYFVHAGDFGWGYELFDNGELLSHISISYEDDPRDSGFVMEVGDASADAFSVFGFNPERLKNLDDIFGDDFIREHIEAGKTWALLNRFRDIININEMANMR